jgi:hypothetical protein
MKDLGTDVYHIEYNRGLFTNHLMHGVVALVGLGAPDVKVASFARHYAQHLDPAYKKSADTGITQETLKDFYGKRKNYPDLIEFFCTELESLRVSGSHVDPLALLLQQHIPDLVDGGIGGAAFHPIIHIGYGLMQDGSGDFIASQRDVIDGLAYMAYSCRRPVGGTSSYEIAESMVKELGLKKEVPQWGSGPEYGIPDLSDTFLMLIESFRSNEEVRKMMSQLPDLASSSQYDSMEPASRFEKKMAALSDDHGNNLIDNYARKAVIALHSRFIGEKSISFISYLMKAVIDGTIGVYANSSIADDFFLLHGVTSSWALRRVLYYFDSFDVSLQILIAYLKAIFSAYVTQGMPTMVSKVPVESLPSWKDIVKKAVGCSDDVDEHVYKLVYTCCEAEKLYGSSSSQLYKRAAAQKMGFIDWPRL